MCVISALRRSRVESGIFAFFAGHKWYTIVTLLSCVDVSAACNGRLVVLGTCGRNLRHKSWTRSSSPITTCSPVSAEKAVSECRAGPFCQAVSIYCRCSYLGGKGVFGECRASYYSRHIGGMFSKSASPWRAWARRTPRIIFCSRREGSPLALVPPFQGGPISTYAMHRDGSYSSFENSIRQFIFSLFGVVSDRCVP